MTKAQRSKHVNEILKAIESKGYKLNRYDKYEKDFGKFKIRIDARKVNLKVERLLNIQGQEWMKIYSEPITSIPIDIMPNLLTAWEQSSNQRYDAKHKVEGTET